MSVKKKIENAKADENGNIKAVKFKGNETYTPIETAIRMTENGQVDAVVVNRRNGDKYLRTRPDNQIQNNLDDMVRGS
jgi:ABC-type amino acid transport substrate-binding protein